MSNMLRSYRRNIVREALKKRGDKQINKRVKFEDEDPHQSRFARIFSEFRHPKKVKAKA